MILFIEISRAAEAADSGRSGDKVIMHGVRASRPCAGVGLIGVALGIRGVLYDWWPNSLHARGQECPRHTSVLPATLFLKCVCRGLGAVTKRRRAVLSLDGRGRPSLHNRMGY